MAKHPVEDVFSERGAGSRPSYWATTYERENPIHAARKLIENGSTHPGELIRKAVDLARRMGQRCPDEEYLDCPISMALYDALEEMGVTWPQAASHEHKGPCESCEDCRLCQATSAALGGCNCE
jgi:hypothetical protein